MDRDKVVNRGGKKSLELLALFVLLYAETSALNCRITTNPEEPANGVNGTVTLKCDALGKLADSFLWRKNKALISNISTPNTSSTLSIAIVKDIHDEEYICTVKRGGDIGQCSRKLKVNMYRKPVINEIEPIYLITDNEDFRVHCKVSGWPSPEIVWRWQGSGTETGKRNNLFRVERQPNDLILQKDAGTVTKVETYLAECTANNTYGVATLKIKLVIFPSEEDPIVPKVTTKSRRVLAYAGQNVTLTCEEKGACKEEAISPTIVWFHNDVSIDHQVGTESQDQCRHFNKLMLRLPRTNVTVKDQGTYRCEVIISYGADYQTIQLVLVHKGFLDVTAELSDIKVQAKNDVTLECMTTYPDVATLGEFWTLNGTLLNISNSRYTKQKYTVIQDLNFTQVKTDEAKFNGTKVKFSLTIHNVTQRDLGLYECGVNTTLGIEKASIQLLRELLAKNSVVKPNPSQEPRQISIGLIAGGAAMCLVMISIALGACYHFHKAKGMKKWDILKSGSYKYDVFVTFSGKDVQWVEGELVPVLEKNCITFCIHNRDFELGKPFVDNMIESVYSSRKVLAIVSKNYMASNFCRGELELALQRSVEEKAGTSLVLLRLDDILKSKLPKLLRGKTFLDYHDTEGRGDWESRLVKTLSEEEAKISV